MSNPFPVHVRDFLQQRIRSIAQLELLLALRNDPQRAWAVGEAAKQLYISPSMAEPLLETLRASGLAVLEPGEERRYRFAASSDELGRLVGELATLYKERPVSTINEIYSLPSQTLKNFADAFRIRKVEDE
jgi:hypothetical protein